MGPAFQVIGQLFKAIDPDSFRRYEAIWEALAQRGGLGNIQSSNWQVFSTIALVHELTVGPHMDDGDLGDGWAAMFVRGVFSGGDLVVPALGMKFPYKQGDLVFMRSSELEHYIDKWEGCRTGAVMFTKVTTVEKLHEEIKKMLEQMKDEEAAAEAKKEEVAAEAKKEDVAAEAKQEDVVPSAKAKDEEAATPFATGAKEEDAIADVHTREAKRKSSPDESPSTMTRRLRSRTIVYTSKS